MACHKTASGVLFCAVIVRVWAVHMSIFVTFTLLWQRDILHALGQLSTWQLASPFLLIEGEWFPVYVYVYVKHCIREHRHKPNIDTKL